MDTIDAPALTMEVAFLFRELFQRASVASVVAHTDICGNGIIRGGAQAIPTFWMFVLIATWSVVTEETSAISAVNLVHAG